MQNLHKKKQALSHLSGIHWHFIGHLQTNKAKVVLEAASFFHALDSKRLLEELASRAAALQKHLPVFIEVNIDHVKIWNKSRRCSALAEAVIAEPHLKLQGLMCIPKAQDPPNRKAFERLRHLGESLNLQNLDLSMGMSDDFVTAIEELKLDDELVPEFLEKGPKNSDPRHRNFWSSQKVTLSIYAPAACQNELRSLAFTGDSLKIKLAAPPEDGAANPRVALILKQDLSRNASSTYAKAGRKLSKQNS